MSRSLGTPSIVAAATAALLLLSGAAPPSARPVCAPDNGGLKLAPGLCATVFASGLGPVRHLVVAPNGDVFAAIYQFGGGVVALHDADGDGVADGSKTFGGMAAHGIALSDGWLYAATDDKIVRWKWADGQLTPASAPQTIVSGLPTGGHSAKSILVAGDQLIVNIGSRTNSCQMADRRDRSPGIEPCTELEGRAGIWRFSASKPGQAQKDGTHMARGLRNTLGLALQPGSGLLFGATHGRDQLSQNWGFSEQKNAENPGEEFVQIRDGDDFGWPYCYWDTDLKSLVLAPEYGGDGKTIGRCAKAKEPVAVFPGHWGPMAVAFARPGALGAAYGEGAFVAFHGSWNRAPLPQAGYRVVFQPMTGAVASGAYTVVAIGAANDTDLRPAGLAVAQDGALFIAADKNGKIWKIVKRS